MRFEALKRVQDALACIRSGQLDELEPGRHDLFDGIYVNVFEYQTKADGLFEAHRGYIDIHYLIEGTELLKIAPVDSLMIEQVYDEQSDSLLGRADGTPYLLKKGQYMVVLPEEAHLPGIAAGEAQAVKKAVVKVPV